MRLVQLGSQVLRCFSREDGVLGDELQIQQTSGAHFQIPTSRRGFVAHQAGPHVEDILGSRCRVTGLDDTLGRRRNPRAKTFVSRHRPQARQGHVLPRPGFRLMIAFERGD